MRHDGKADINIVWQRNAGGTAKGLYFDETDIHTVRFLCSENCFHIALILRAVGGSRIKLRINEKTEKSAAVGGNIAYVFDKMPDLWYG